MDVEESKALPEERSIEEGAKKRNLIVDQCVCDSAGFRGNPNEGTHMKGGSCEKRRVPGRMWGGTVLETFEANVVDFELSRDASLKFLRKKGALELHISGREHLYDPR